VATLAPGGAAQARDVLHDRAHGRVADDVLHSQRVWARHLTFEAGTTAGVDVGKQNLPGKTLLTPGGSQIRDSLHGPYWLLPSLACVLTKIINVT
jgi:hypothetical protein